MGEACAVRLAGTVDVLLLVDRDEASVAEAAEKLSSGDSPANAEPFALDITDVEGLDRLARTVRERGTLRSVAHAAGISPTMAGWADIVKVDLVGTARLVDALVPVASTGTALVCFASIAPHLAFSDVDPAADAVLDNPLDPLVAARLHEVVGTAIEDPGMAYSWAKRGVHRLVQREAVRLGRLGARICSVSPGIIDTPMGRQEAEAHSTNELLVQHTPLGREGRSEEVAAVVAFLLSDEASFVNGIDVPVDGGVVAALRGTLSGRD
jgi:NAD(P)-dependent dehydrogenase (short-subunit alcohol dehydrogenase family)